MIGFFWFQQSLDSIYLVISSIFFKVGALVFGGGHVVLPLLSSELIARDLIHQDLFMAGYGATQTVPGPLFTFAAYLGASMGHFKSIWLGGFFA